MAEPAKTSPKGPFELSGGALCLDFVNTWEDRSRQETEKLRGYGDLVEFARQAELLDDERTAGLERRAASEEASAEAAFSTAVELREAIYRIFSSRAGRGTSSPQDLALLNRALAEAVEGVRIVRRGTGFSYEWRAPADSLTAPLRPIVRSAAELLTSDGLDRVRECDGARCTWLFLDRSRNRSRRWCSMETCGNRAKVRRHYRRHQAREG